MHFGGRKERQWQWKRQGRVFECKEEVHLLINSSLVVAFLPTLLNNWIHTSSHPQPTRGINDGEKLGWHTPLKFEIQLNCTIRVVYGILHHNASYHFPFSVALNWLSPSLQICLFFTIYKNFNLDNFQICMDIPHPIFYFFALWCERFYRSQ